MLKPKRTSRKQLWLMLEEGRLKAQAKAFLKRASQPTVKYYLNGMDIKKVFGVEVSTGGLVVLAQ